MKQIKLTSVTVAAACTWLLAGCSGQHQGSQHSMGAEARLRVADAAEASGDRQTALSMYAASSNDAPNDTTVQLRAAEGMARNGGLQDASTLLSRRLQATPNDPELLRTQGAIQVMAGEPGKAVLTLSAVLAKKPDDVKALANKAVALDMLHKHAEAQVLYRQALAVEPSDIAISNDLALSLLLSGRREEARDTLAPFRDVPNLPERVAVNLGILDAASGHSSEARQSLGSRIGASDLASLTQAISMQTGGFQPDENSRIVSHGALPEANAAYTGEAPRADAPVAWHRPAQETSAWRDSPSAVTHASAPPQTAAVSHAVKPDPQTAKAELAEPHDVAPAAHEPVFTTVPVAAPVKTVTASGGPLQERQVPHAAVPATEPAVPRHLVQEPLPAPAGVPVHADAPVTPHRPLQEEVTVKHDPAVERADATPVSHRPLQEEAVSDATVARGASR